MLRINALRYSVGLFFGQVKVCELKMYVVKTVEHIFPLLGRHDV